MGIEDVDRKFPEAHVVPGVFRLGAGAGSRDHDTIVIPVKTIDGNGIDRRSIRIVPKGARIHVGGIQGVRGGLPRRIEIDDFTALKRGRELGTRKVRT
jgi:hypothetical protein